MLTVPLGRSQEKDAAIRLDDEIRALLLGTDTPYTIIEGDAEAPRESLC